MPSEPLHKTGGLVHLQGMHCGIGLLFSFLALVLVTATAQTDTPPAQLDHPELKKIEVRKLIKVDGLLRSYTSALEALQRRLANSGELEPVLEVKNAVAGAKATEGVPDRPAVELVPQLGTMHDNLLKAIRAAEIDFGKQSYGILKADVERLDAEVRRLTRGNRLAEAQRASASLKKHQAELETLTAKLKGWLAKPPSPAEARLALLRKADLYFPCNRLHGGNTVQGVSTNHHRAFAKDVRVVPGKHGGAYYFNGTSSGIRLDPKPWGGEGPLSLALWVRGAEESGLDEPYARLVHKMATDRRIPGFIVCVGEKSSVIAARLVGKGRDGVQSPPVANNTWVHVAFTVDGNGQATMYLDGKEIDGKDLRGISWSSFGPDQFYLGRRAAGEREKDEPRPFTGAIDEFLIFKRVLNADEVALLAQ